MENRENIKNRENMPRALRKTGLVLFPAFDWCISPDHPEREERLLYTRDQLIEEGLEDVEGIVFYNPELADYHAIDRVHLCAPSSKELLSQSHRISAGGAIRAADARMSGSVERAFAIVRPPGHHAMQTVFGDRGFCVANIEAVMVEHIRKKYGVKKIAIIDTDCHHGDGTQDIFYNDPDTLFISLHQDGRTLYPGSGFQNEMGGPAARGYTINLPLPPATGEEGFAMVMEQAILPIVEEFQPELIINSAGQDNHYTDPLTNMNFTAQGYARLNRQLNPDICVLEGGYSIEGALPYTNLGIILAMAGLDTSCVREPDYNPENFRQPPEMNAIIEGLCANARAIFASRITEKERQGFSRGEVVEERQTIYYDTTGFGVDQLRRFILCPHCAGYSEIEARGAGQLLHAFSVPFNACARCAADARDSWQRQVAGKGSGATVILQDRREDIYLVG